MFLLSLVNNTNILVNDNGILESYNPFVWTRLREGSYRNICKFYNVYTVRGNYIDIAHCLYHAYIVIYTYDNKELKEYYQKCFYQILQDVYDHNFYDSYIIKVTVFNLCSNACQEFHDQSLLKYILKDIPVNLNHREKKYLMKYVDEIPIEEIIKKFDYYTNFMCENAKVWITLDNNKEHREYWSVPLDILKSDRKLDYTLSDNYEAFCEYEKQYLSSCEYEEDCSD